MIGDHAFQRCISLRSVEISEGVNIIGAHAFQRCLALTSVVIPDSVTEIGRKAFYHCHGLTQMLFEGDAPVCGNNWVGDCGSNLVISYYRGALGFTAPAWNGITTMPIEVVNISVITASTVVLPGQPMTYVIEVSNCGPRPLELSLALSSIAGYNVLVPLSWYSLESARVSLGPGSSVIVWVNITIPSSWAAVEDVRTSIGLSATDISGARLYDDATLHLKVKATELSAVLAIHGSTIDIINYIEIVQAHPSDAGIDNIRAKLVSLIATIQKAVDNGLVGTQNGHALLVSANAALGSVDKSDAALDRAKLNLVQNALETAQNQLEALLNKLRYP